MIQKITLLILYRIVSTDQPPPAVPVLHPPNGQVQPPLVNNGEYSISYIIIHLNLHVMGSESRCMWYFEIIKRKQKLLLLSRIQTFHVMCSVSYNVRELFLLLTCNAHVTF